MDLTIFSKGKTGSSDETQRGAARVLAVAVAVTLVLVGGFVYQSIRAHQREVAEEGRGERQRAIWDTPNYGYAPELAHTADPSSENEKLANPQRVKQELRRDLAYQRYLDGFNGCLEPVLASKAPPRCVPLSREAWESDPLLGVDELSRDDPPGPTVQERVKADARKRRAARAKRTRKMDRAYEEYLAGFPECEPFVDGALLNDLCGPRPLSRKEWEQREKATEPASAIVDDPLRELGGL